MVPGQPRVYSIPPGGHNIRLSKGMAFSLGFRNKKGSLFPVLPVHPSATTAQLYFEFLVGV
jgi:hypothetical protein